MLRKDGVARPYLKATAESRERGRKTRAESSTQKKALGIGSALRAIRAKCLECSNEQPYEVFSCTMPGCPLWPYRMGRNPRPKDLKVAQFSKAEEVAGYEDFRGASGGTLPEEE